MCWTNYIAIPLVLKKPLRVYKVDTISIFGGFISLYRDFMYREYQIGATTRRDYGVIYFRLLDYI